MIRSTWLSGHVWVPPLLPTQLHHAITLPRDRVESSGWTTSQTLARLFVYFVRYARTMSQFWLGWRRRWAGWQVNGWDDHPPSTQTHIERVTYHAAMTCQANDQGIQPPYPHDRPAIDSITTDHQGRDRTRSRMPSS